MLLLTVNGYGYTINFRSTLLLKKHQSPTQTQNTCDKVQNATVYHDALFSLASME